MLWKVKVFFLRLLDYFLGIPHRIIRFLKWIFWRHLFFGKHKFFRWFIGLFLLAIDLTPIPVLLETLLDFIKIKTKSLDDHQKEIALEIFGNRFPLELIGLDPDSIIARKRKNLVFVSFHTINSAGMISDAIFIHELVHIWQYRKYGSLYISEAIWAQKWGGGYNYGGLTGLQASKGLTGFNFEQQADIVEDYFRLKNNMSMHWMKPSDQVQSILANIVSEVRK